jgi:glucose-6-phosphate 1-dehydrogenase
MARKNSGSIGILELPKEKIMSNRIQQWPECDLDSASLRPEPSFIVVFGATGDLSHRKLFPALFDLHLDGLLPNGVVLLGFARKSLTSEAFRKDLAASCSTYSRHKEFSDGAWDRFAQRIFYLESNLEDPAGYELLAKIIHHENNPVIPFDGSGETLPFNVLFYLAVGPEYFGSIANRLGQAGLGTAPGLGSPRGKGWKRLVVEKPYGRDMESSLSLTETLNRSFRETDIYRIDHYLGKETVQNLLYLRFANAVFEPIWNSNHIESIDISVFETEGIGSRGGYYDSEGAARDMLQNHLVQLLCLVTMEPPATLDPERIRDEKVKVLRTIPDYSRDELIRRSVRGQYTPGSSLGDTASGSNIPAVDNASTIHATIPGYLGENKIRPNSTTETYVSFTVSLDNWRFSSVPITLRTGKAFAEKYSEIVIHFRRPPAALFAAHCGDTLSPNCLTIRIQPDEGVWLRFNSKIPGRSAIKPSELRFSYRQVSDYFPEAYERLLADALSGDSTLFIRSDESEQSWRVIDALLAAWASADPGSAPEKGGLWMYPAFSPVPDVKYPTRPE